MPRPPAPVRGFSRDSGPPLTLGGVRDKLHQGLRPDMPLWVLALRITGLGWYIGICIILGVIGGLWLDRRLDTVPAFTLAGTALGSVVAFYGMYRIVAEFLEQEDNNNGDQGKP